MESDVVLPSKKELKEYLEEYSKIPDDMFERLIQLSENMTNKNVNNFIENAKNNLETKWDEIKFIFYFIPKATPRARFTRCRRHFYVSDAKNNQNLMINFCKENLKDFKMIATPCKFYADIYFPTPKGMTKEEKLRSELKLIHHVSKPDWDNLGKTYSDMVQNTIILDDSLIIEGKVTKYYSIKPRIEITILFPDLLTIMTKQNLFRADIFRLWLKSTNPIPEYALTMLR